MIGRTNVGGGAGGAGGAGGGATLVISSPANVSVTVSKDDKSYTKNSGSLGSTTFKGLVTGTWTVTISGNGQIATRTIEITADYAITIAFFSATINITYPANSTCAVANSSGQTVASDINAASSEKTFTATVNATGTYTVTATATDGSGNTKSESVEITSEGQSESVTLSYQLVLFEGGTGKENWTGRVKQVNGFYASYSIGNKLSVYAAAAGSVYGQITSASAVDLSKYNTLTLSIDSVNWPYDGLYGYLNVYIGTDAYGDTVASTKVSSAGDICIDISELMDTAYYITLSASCSKNASGFPEYSFSCSKIIAS